MKATVRRLGISIFEVLISMAVATVGLMGVLVMIPVATRQAEHGLNLDDAAAMASNAQAEFRIRAIHAPQTRRLWVETDQASNGEFRKIFRGQIAPGQLPWFYRNEWCTDPDFFEAFPMTATESRINNFNGLPANRFFPFDYRNLRSLPGHNGLPRILRGIYDSKLSNFVIQNPGTTQQIFTSNNQLVFTNPPTPAASGKIETTFTRDNTYPPLQKYVGEENGFRTKRSTTGTTSWMSMLIPSSPSLNSTEVLEQNPPLTLYTIVFNKRNLGDIENEPPEHICEVANVEINLPVYGSGEIVLGAFWDPNLGDNELNVQLRTEELKILTNDWIVLSQMVTTGPNAPYTRSYPRFQWYRVTSTDGVAVDPTQLSSNPHGVVTRTISVQGPNWDYYRPNSNSKVYATIVRNVIGVYESTIQPARSSLWNPDIF